MRYGKYHVVVYRYISSKAAAEQRLSRRFYDEFDLYGSVYLHTVIVNRKRF